jgi:hypothetical protein
MPSLSPYRKPPRTPPGCENHLTRQQAAQLLGFSSEFKIRQLEREGRLQAVRGPMRTAFYARAEVLAVKAELAQEGPGQETPDGWTDAELLLLLGSPTRQGRPRSALDLVLETRISIERAERVYAFWNSARGAEPAPSAARLPASQSRASEPVTAVAHRPQPNRPAPEPESQDERTAKAAPSAADQPAVKPAAAVVSPAVAVKPMVAIDTGVPQRSAAGATSAPVLVAEPLPTDPPADLGSGERRSEDRLSRDVLIQQLRDPDPRIRHRAFALLKECHA